MTALVGALETTPASDGPIVDVVRRALFLHAVSKSAGTMAAAGARLGTHHRILARAWATFERSPQVDDLSGGAPPADPRTRREKRRRRKICAAAFRIVPRPVRAFVEAVDALPAIFGSKVALVERILTACALRHSVGDIERAAKLLRMTELRAKACLSRLESAVLANTHRLRTAPADGARAFPVGLREKLIALATRFGFEIVAAASRTPVTELMSI